MTLRSASRSTGSSALSRPPSPTGASYSSPALAQARPIHNIAGEMVSRFNQTVEDTLASWRQKPDLALVVYPGSRTHIPEEYCFTEMSKKFFNKSDYLLEFS